MANSPIGALVVWGAPSIPSHRVRLPNLLSALDSVPVRAQWKCAETDSRGPTSSPVALGGHVRP